MAMTRVGIICKKDRPEPEEILRSLVPWLKKRGLEVMMAPAASGDSVCSLLSISPCPEQELADKIDLAVVLGGDGTMLGAARLLAHRGVPILGVNLGELGFITEIASNEILSAMDNVLAGRCPTQERSMLTAQIEGESQQHPALNDILVTRGSTPRMISMEAAVNDSHVNTFRADGIVIATPTGSTAYSLSSDGPILFPTVDCVVMNPICPHTLTNRPIVLPDNVTIRITVTKAEMATVMHDGLVLGNIEQGQTVIIKKWPHKAKLLMPPDMDHFAVLRGKLHWGER